MVHYSSSIAIPYPEKPLLMLQFAGGLNFGTAMSGLEVRNDRHTPYLFQRSLTLDAWLRCVHLDEHGVLPSLRRPEEHVCQGVGEEGSDRSQVPAETTLTTRIPEQISIGTKSTVVPFIAFSCTHRLATRVENNEHQFDVSPPKEIKFMPRHGRRGEETTVAT
ncbi:Aste57867_24446 [Aphanomyces stellatus]|uniref:Aste57867_24446 protein n=1 Tax=Aphanomyces stellatus TaxID=120398 RepID=A0A485LSC9_9STRA|nr:hypothetical protein As57867_024370 [Aphanomyces stellatus]VFU01086.1 Aste57867_24446 [Aphanomyces stellatus]